MEALQRRGDLLSVRSSTFRVEPYNRKKVVVGSFICHK
jgi:hypothetical protein